MRRSTALHKKVSMVVKAYHDIHGVDFIHLTINDVFVGKFNAATKAKLEDATDMQFVDGCEYGFVVDTFKVDKEKMMVNGRFVCELAYGGLWAIHGAFHPVTGYSIEVRHNVLNWVYSWSQDWHVENRVATVEYVTTQDYKKAIEELKVKYAPLVKHNEMFDFSVIEFRGEDFNRKLDTESVGYEPNNFDEKIREHIFR